MNPDCPIHAWLNSLEQQCHRKVDADLNTLVERPYPFLCPQTVSHHIVRLSTHLGTLRCDVRRSVIVYSLYVRQLHALQESMIRETCARSCPRPPAGCCGADHHVILSLTDIVMARPSPAAMHLAHTITLLQHNEHAHALSSGRQLRQGFCGCLAVDGCTLRLFKSPRCIHYLCDGIEVQLGDAFKNPGPFLDAMRRANSLTITTEQDFMEPLIIEAAARLFL